MTRMTTMTRFSKNPHAYVQELFSQKNFTHVRMRNLKLKIMIEDRDYSKQELADAIYGTIILPKSRLEKLRREITGCKPLVEELRRMHSNPGDLGYTAPMVERIKYYLDLE